MNGDGTDADGDGTDADGDEMEGKETGRILGESGRKEKFQLTIVINKRPPENSGGLLFKN